jgi:SAM-dependent methyltransferase
MTATPVAPAVDVTGPPDRGLDTSVRSHTSRTSVHVETGRSLARRLGYDGRLLAAVPGPALDGFAGVGNPLRLARLHPGERVLDLGSGSGTDLFAAALCVGPTGLVVGRVPTGVELARIEHLRATHGFDNVELSAGPIESLPFADGSFDAVVSNGVLHRSARTSAVVAEAARVLRSGGRLAVSDVVTAGHPSRAVARSGDAWNEGRGDAGRLDEYRELVREAGFEVLFARRNTDAFVTERVAGATGTWDVMSVTLLASRR